VIGSKTKRRDAGVRAHYKESGRLLADAIEDMVYGIVHDGLKKNMIKAGKTAKQFLESGSAKEAMDAIQAALTEEGAIEKPSPPPPPPSDPDLDAGVELTDLTTAEQREKDEEGKLQDYVKFVEKTVDTFVEYVLEADTAEEQAVGMSKTFLGSLPRAVVMGDCGTPLPDVTYDGPVQTCGLIYFQAQSGQSASSPHTRMPRLRPEYVKKQIKSACIAAGDGDSLHPDFVVVATDGGSSGNESIIGNTLVKDDLKIMEKHKKRYHVSYEEQSLNERRLKQGAGFIDQNEGTDQGPQTK
jgi:hypothetical protein